LAGRIGLIELLEGLRERAAADELRGAGNATADGEVRVDDEREVLEVSAMIRDP